MNTIPELRQMDPHAQDYIDFLNESHSPYHAIAAMQQRLEADGFCRLKERDAWSLEAGKKYYLTRDGNSLFAFKMPAGKPTRFVMAGAHSESPVWRLKSTAHALNKKGLRMCAVEPYGGGLWQTWVDRDLTMSGRLMVKSNDSIETLLVDAGRPIFRFPSIAIHLAKERKDPLNFDLANDFIALFGDSDDSDESEEGKKKAPKIRNGWDDKLMRLLLDSAGRTDLAVDDVLDFDLDLRDVTPAGTIGFNNEFIAGQRQDNLHGSYTSMRGFMSAQPSSDAVQIFASFNHEEVGSRSNTGANSVYTASILRRVLNTVSEDEYQRFIASSFIVSNDMSHSVHPTLSDRHDSTVDVKLNKGCVLKISGRQAYASSGSSSALLRFIAESNKIPLQIVSNKNTVRGGGTIGSMVAALTGCLTVDIGGPLLGMHSIRELCGVKDVSLTISLIQTVFDQAQTRMALE
ncbi:aspartyl aminopeptidase [Carpediemonas membranifera]|uniref:aspartyl aminopeptidase n=1 Tax=Carpediemonas membranifera TaxID=201153 RepID=A0A8J6B5D6_9EUKA|nr:aspartyl aminopeptidase [Carpediemonas membranifera]|eukprot:KAG9396018.1 aspartyl aminopeptidase [Carpediemonas membranifera]